MKFNFNQPLKTIEGEILKNEVNKDFTFGAACQRALMVSEPDQQGDEKMKCYNLALMRLLFLGHN